MTIREMMQAKQMSVYKLSKRCRIPYATLNDLCNERSSLDKCSAETVYRLAQGLDVTMEELLRPIMEPRCTFDLFKSNICHRLKEQGDIPFLIETLRSDDIRAYAQKEWYPECFYLLAMTDYISRMNQVPLCEDYDDLRRMKLREPVFPSGILTIAAAEQDERVKQQALKNAIPEFLRFNIVESEVYNVV